VSDFFDGVADDDFNRVRTRELIERIRYFLNPGKHNLLSFTDVKTLVRPASETYLGIQVVPLDLIVGSEGRYRDFNSHFLPKRNFLKNRWISVDKANLKDVILPPVALYEIGGVYFVRDGNHRVSVAKTQGAVCIDAEVIGLASEIFIKPGMTIDDLRTEVVSYEKRVFYGETGFGDLTDCWDLDFTSPGRYEEIYTHIQVHKYYINQGIGTELPFSDAVVSWYRGVYRPVIDAIEDSRILLRFPGRTKSDLYVFIVKHWDRLKRTRDFSIDIAEAAEDFTRSYGPKKTRRITAVLDALFRRFRK
jgi:hypothetical protein